VIQVVEAFDQEVVGFVDVFIQTSAIVEKMAGEFALLRNLLFGEEIGWFLAVLGCCGSGRCFRERRFRGHGFSAHEARLAEDCLPLRMLASFAARATINLSGCDACPSISAPNGLYS